MEKIVVVGYAFWASHLVNGDPSGMANHEFAAMQRWLQSHGVHDDECASVDFDGGIASPEGTSWPKGECATFTFFVHPGDMASRRGF